MDLDVASIQLNGATIKDDAGNDASFDLPAHNDSGSLSDNSSIRVDASAPTGILVVPGPGSLTVTVQAPTWSPQLYSFEASVDGVNWQGVSSASTSATIGGLIGDRTYQVRVAGVALIADLENRVLVNGRSKLVVADYVSRSARTTSISGTAGPAGPAGPAGASAPASTVSTQALGIAVANAESATALANEKAKALDVAKAAAELAKNQTLEAAQLAKSNAEKLAVELSLLALTKNSITVKKGTSTSRINLNLSDDHADTQGMVQIKKPGTKRFVNAGMVVLDKSGDGFVKIKGTIKKGTSIRVLVDGAVVKSIMIK
jgi:hypothetical protein